MKVTRTFYKTGQALFAVERITCHDQQRTIVYDCGGNNVNEVKRAINAIKDVTVIDAVFISHYHTDHINGLRFLLKYFTVERLFLPMLSPDKELVLACNSHLYQKHQLYNSPRAFLMKSGVKNMPKIYMVMTEGDSLGGIENQVEDEKNSPNQDSTDNISPSTKEGNAIRPFDSIIPSGIEIDFDFLDKDTQTSTSNAPCWRFIPFNRQTLSKQQWRSFLQQVGLDVNLSPNEVKREWGNVRIANSSKRISPANALKKIINITDEELNEYSMTLYSGPINRGLCSEHDCMGCLYYGDYNTKNHMPELKKKYQYYWHNIGVVQVPHHGSLPSYSSNIIVCGAKYVIPNDNSLVNRRKYVDSSIVENNIRNLGENVIGVTVDIFI